MKIFVMALAAAATVTASPVLAKPLNEERVSYRDLNLATPEGQQIMQKRLDKAARNVCRFDSNGQIRTPEAENACFREARKQAAVRFAEIISEERRGG